MTKLIINGKEFGLKDAELYLNQLREQEEKEIRLEQIKKKEHEEKEKKAKWNVVEDTFENALSLLKEYREKYGNEIPKGSKLIIPTNYVDYLLNAEKFLREIDNGFNFRW